MLDCRFARKNYLQINVFPNLVIVKQEENSYILSKKAIKKATNKMVRETAS